jgi:hypothetical protein
MFVHGLHLKHGRVFNSGYERACELQAVHSQTTKKPNPKLKIWPRFHPVSLSLSMAYTKNLSQALYSGCECACVLHAIPS